MAILDMHARNVAAGKKGVLIADERTMIQMDAVAAGFERHGLPYPSGIVLDGQAIQTDLVGPDRHRIAVVGGQLAAIDDFAGIVVPDDAGFSHFIAQNPDLVLVDVERHLLAIDTGHDPHRAPLRRFRRQGVEAFLNGPEIPAAVAVDGINRLCRGRKNGKENYRCDY